MTSSQLYRQQIIDLTEWFTVRLRRMPFIRPTEAQKVRGIDALPQPYRDLAKEAFDLWLAERSYELSYNQMCIAFWSALPEVEYAILD